MRIQSIFLSAVLAASGLIASARGQTPEPVKPKQPFIGWHQTGAELLGGPQGYKLEPGKNFLGTFWHANSTKIGDNYGFCDVSQGGGRYCEFTSRFSASKTSGKSIKIGPVTDILGVVNMEFPKGLKPALLYGAGVDLKIPGTRFVQFHAMRRDDLGIKGSTFQLTTVWEAARRLKKGEIVFAGFADWAGHEGGSAANLITQPRFLYFIKPIIGFGVEVDHRTNKFGVQGVRETVVQPMLVVRIP